MRSTMNKKVSSKKYMESLYNEEEAIEASYYGEDSQESIEQRASAHKREDSSGSMKKKESVSNSIKALQDKIKKDLDLSEAPNDFVKSPTMSVKSFRANFEKNNNSANNSPNLNHNNGYTPKLGHARGNSNAGSLGSVGIKSPKFGEKSASEFERVKSKPGNNTVQKPIESPKKTYAYMKTSNKEDTVKPKRELVTNKENTVTSTNTKSGSNTNGATQDSPVSVNRKKMTIPQFRVIKKTSNSAIETPLSPVSVYSNEEQKTNELRQLQLIDKEISKKISKIKSEIKFIDDSLPPNPCIHDFQSRKKLMAAKTTLEKSLEFWEKKKYENGINFSKLTRKVVYSGGEEVTTFFSGRNE